MSKTSKRLTTAGLAGALLVGVGGAVAAAAVPDANGVINGCYTTTGSLFGSPKGNLRVIDEGEKCRSSERALPWNQQGPKGEKGDQGPAGPAGEPGPAGPAAAPSAKLAAKDAGVHFVGNSFHTAVSISLPAGTWALTAKGIAGSSRDKRMFVVCHLRHGDNSLDRSEVVADDLDNATIPVSLVSIVTMPSASTVEVACRTNEDGAYVFATSILAIAVSGSAPVGTSARSD